MKGISEIKAKENSVKYRTMYEQWLEQKVTLEQLGKKHDITKQRMWQIVTRCKLGEGDYYYGVQIARNKWSEFKSLYSDVNQTQRAFNEWLKEKDVKLTANNQKVAPHTGWDW